MHYYNEGRNISLELPIVRGYLILGYSYSSAGSAESIVVGILSFTWTNTPLYIAVTGKSPTITVSSGKAFINLSDGYSVVSAYDLK